MKLGSGRSILDLKLKEPNVRLLTDMVTVSVNSERKVLIPRVQLKFVELNGGIASNAHRNALIRRDALRLAYADSLTTIRVAVAQGSAIAIGLGNHSGVLELGMTLHRTLGVPYIPATAVRGVSRAFLGMQGSEETTGLLKRLFGDINSPGAITILDALPNLDVRTDTEVMTPHFTEWYADETEQVAPGEWFTPVPVNFLVVRSGTFLIDFLCTDSALRIEATKVLSEALWEIGIGGKTSSGFGLLKAAV